MKRISFNRFLTLALSVMVFMMFTLISAVEVNAASGTKTFYVISERTSTYVSSDNSKPEKDTTKFTYNKNGLLKQVATSGGNIDGHKVVYLRNKAGAVTDIKQYNSNGKLVQSSTNTIKNGKVTKTKNYSVDPKTGKKTLESTTTLTYKNGKISKSSTKGKDYTETDTYYTNGKIKKSVYKTGSSVFIYNYDKKGHHTTSTSNETYGDIVSASKATYKITTNKKGDITKEVMTEKTTTNGVTSTAVSTTTYKLTYNKSGRLIKSVSNYTSKGDNFKYSSKTTTTYKYKAVKVAKKYWKYA